MPAYDPVYSTLVIAPKADPELTLQLKYFNEHLFTLHDQKNKIMYVTAENGGCGLGNFSTMRLVSLYFHKKALANGVDSTTAGFAEMLNKYKDLSFSIEKIEDVKFHVDSGFVDPSAAPANHVFVYFTIEWTMKDKGKMKKMEQERRILFIRISQAQFDGL